jgi:hypothetical protein
MAGCTPEQMARCPLKRHYTDVHHLYYPRRDYTDPIDKAFRNLPENTEEHCRWEHIEIHDEEKPPHKPSLETMVEAVLRSEVHLSARVQAALQAQQRVISNYWRTAEERAS